MILAFPALILEGPGVLAWIAVQESLVKPCIILFGSGIFAFCLNFSIFYVIKTTTAVTFNVGILVNLRSQELQDGHVWHVWWWRWSEIGGCGISVQTECKNSQRNLLLCRF